METGLRQRYLISGDKCWPGRSRPRSFFSSDRPRASGNSLVMQITAVNEEGLGRAPPPLAARWVRIALNRLYSKKNKRETTRSLAARWRIEPNEPTHLLWMQVPHSPHLLTANVFIEAREFRKTWAFEDNITMNSKFSKFAYLHWRY